VIRPNRRPQHLRLGRLINVRVHVTGNSVDDSGNGYDRRGERFGNQRVFADFRQRFRRLFGRIDRDTVCVRDSKTSRPGRVARIFVSLARAFYGFYQKRHRRQHGPSDTS